MNLGRYRVARPRPHPAKVTGIGEKKRCFPKSTGYVVETASPDRESALDMGTRTFVNEGRLYDAVWPGGVEEVLAEDHGVAVVATFQRTRFAESALTRSPLVAWIFV